MTEEDRSRRFDNEAATYSARYVDPVAIARAQYQLVRSWGAPVSPPAEILEIGCADGFSTSSLVRNGYSVTGLDFSVGMLDEARARVGDLARFIHADINTWEPDTQYDAVLALMWEFFTYVRDPACVLTRLRPWIRTKLLIDINPRTHDLGSALDTVRAAGFREIQWKPFFVPQRVRLNPATRLSLRLAERIPIVRSVILRRKFVVVIRAQA